MGWHDPGSAARTAPRAMMVIDIVSFGDPSRTDDIQIYLRDALYRITREALARAGVALEKCYSEDRGDGILVVLPSELPPVSLLDPTVLEFSALIRRHNTLSSPAAQLQLRMAVHVGAIHRDDIGIVGSAVTHLFRLLEARVFKEAVWGSTADLGLIISDRFYDNVVRHGLGMLDPAAFQPVKVTVKETVARGWVYLPDSSPGRSDANVSQNLPSGPDSPMAGPRRSHRRRHRFGGNRASRDDV